MLGIKTVSTFLLSFSSNKNLIVPSLDFCTSTILGFSKLISLEKPKIVDIQKSKDGTIKFLLELKDKRNVETGLIPDKSQSR